MIARHANNKWKHVIKKFDRESNLTYMGDASRRNNSMQPVLGFTTSVSHRDENYSLGSLGGYNLAFVERTDKISNPRGGAINSVRWLILAIELKTNVDIPHFFINSNGRSMLHYARFFEVFPYLKPVKFGTFESYSHEFLERFLVYAKPSDDITVERLFPASSTRILSAHFWPLSIEQAGGVLYLYYDEKNITPRLLKVLCENGLWLAHHIDSRIENI